MAVVLAAVGLVVKIKAAHATDRAIGISDVPRVITDLREEFESLRGFLSDAHERQEDDSMVRKWMSEIKDLNYEAQEITDKHLHRIARHRQLLYGHRNRIKRLLDSVVLGREATEIYALTNKISRITANMKAYGIEYRRAAEPIADAIELAVPCVNDEDEGIVVGVDEDIKTIEKQLVSVGSTKVVGICGVNGLGKTTLIREVLKRGIIEANFDHAVVWVSLGKDSQVFEVLNHILLKLSPGEVILDGLGEDELCKKISQILKEKRCLVVLDDLQTPEAWDGLRSAFSSILNEHSSSKLVLTTCDAKVVSYVDRRGFFHQPRFLNREEKWQLLTKGAFAGKGIKGRILKVTRKPIIDSTIGLPLTIHIFGGLIKCDHPLLATLYPYIKHKNSEATFPWGNSPEQPILEVEVVQVLKLSHAFLGRRLRLCMTRMLDYPEGFEIPAEGLFNLWIDNDVITPKRRSTAKEVAQRCLEKLVERSLIQVVDKDNTSGNIKSCRMHSVVRDFYFNLSQVRVMVS